MTSDKCRTKAMKIAAKTRVISVALEGSDKDQLAVIGEDVDSAKLTCLLGKKLCYASILSVEEMKPEENEDKESDDEKQQILNCTITPSFPPFPRFHFTFKAITAQEREKEQERREQEEHPAPAIGSTQHPDSTGHVAPQHRRDRAA
ncbi:hypothetical protein SO802_014192 [Lithocarpus litseifolius]|uniref:Uncharacterized protein n=1 Tax=Lithocarpus litseifolius TaxID=425828 RepID=A0AAW2CVF9_9ROSI